GRTADACPRDVDDPAPPPLDHRRKDRAGRMDGPEEVHLDGAAPFREVAAGEWTDRPVDPGVVDEDLDWADVCGSSRHRALDLRRIGHVGLQGETTDAGPAGDLRS